MEKPSFEVIIPTWNGIELIKKNLPKVLEAIREVSSPSKKLTVVDDGSSDDTAKFIQENYPEVSLIIHPKNLGFHAAINHGAARSEADIILLLNSDMEPDSFAFQNLYERFLIDKELFAVSGKIYSSDKSAFLYGNRGGFFEKGHFHLKEKPEMDNSQTLFVCGGAGAYRRDKFLELGGFDTLFSPFYYEEQDISYRALKRGWKITYEPKSAMYHQVSATIQKKVNDKKKRLISARNNYLFVFKNITDLKWTLEALLFAPLFSIGSLLKGNPRFFLSFLLALPRVPLAFLKRFKEQKFFVRGDREVFQMVNPN